MQVKVYFLDNEQREPQTYTANHARTSFKYDGAVVGGTYTEVCIETETVTPEYSMFGNKKRDWKSWHYKTVALIKTDLIERIEITQ